MFGVKRTRNRVELTERVLIHIGKCGGASLKASLREAGIADELRIVHIRQPTYQENQKYIIVARNPVERTVSAFNWRYKLVVVDEEQRDRFSGEYEVLTRSRQS